MLGGTAEEESNVKCGLMRPWRGKLRSSKEVDEAKRTNIGGIGPRSPRPRETDPWGEGSCPALIGTAIYFVPRHHTMASRKSLGRRLSSETWEHSADQNQMLHCSWNCTNAGEDLSLHKLLSRINPFPDSSAHVTDSQRKCPRADHVT